MAGKARAVWTDAELEALRQLYPGGGPRAVMAALPGRTYEACATRAKKLGIKGPPGCAATEARWTAAEVATLRRIFPVDGPTAAAAALPGRTVDACETKAARLGLDEFQRQWTTTEIATLRRVYPFGGREAAAAALPGRSERACASKARLLKIKRRQGWHADRRRQSHQLPPKKIELIEVCCKRGFNTLEIAKALGVSRTTVYRYGKAP